METGTGRPDRLPGRRPARDVQRLSGVRGAANASLGLLPAGPEEEERKATRHVVLLEIEDPFRQRLVEWRLETPDVYQWTAQVAVAVAMRVTARA